MKTIIVVTRHPDYANDIEVYDSEADEVGAEVIDIDLGSSFDGRPDDHDQWVEWAESMLHDITDLPGDHGARQSIESTIRDTNPDGDAQAPERFIEWLADLTVTEAVSHEGAALIAGMLRLFTRDPRTLFIELDERPGQYDEGYATGDWHWKLRQARNGGGNRFFELI